MNKCQKCGKETKNAKFCSHSCSASVVNVGRRRHGDPTPRNICLTCGTKTRHKKYCSRSCAQRYYTKKQLELFEQGENIPAKSGGAIRGFLREYLLQQADYTCLLCGFRKQNPYSKRWVVEIDHIDGKWQNNTKGNLRVICPNCSAATPNYKAMNAGNGRKYTPTRRKA